MEKNIEIGTLYEFYGKLLTDKQASVINLYYINDLSLFEIAEELHITRQGVLKQIKDAEKLLIQYEDKLELVKNFYANSKIADKAIKKLEKIKNNENETDVNHIILDIQKLI